MSAYLGEAQLLGWSESHNAGAKLTLALPDPSDLKAFRTMTVRKGKQAGQVLACLLVEMQDGEDTLAALQRALVGPGMMVRTMPEPQPGGEVGPLCRLAVMWCKRPDFQGWLQPVYDKYMGGTGVGSGDVSVEDFQTPELWARHAVLAMCKVDSRKSLDHIPAARESFERLIRLPFHKFLEHHRFLEAA